MSFVEEAEHLVKRLYTPAPPSEVPSIEKRLQQLQHAHGWELADALLHNDDQNVRFFGCLTYTVKINVGGAALDAAHLDSLLTKLLDWLVKCVKANDKFLVLRKLCSTIVTYFVLPNVTWDIAVRHVLCCLQSGQALPGQVLARFPPTKDLLQLLQPAQLKLLQIFATDVAEYAARIDHTQQSNATHGRIRSNLEDALTIIEYNLDGAAEQTADSISETLKCYKAWTAYGRQEYASSSEEMREIRLVFSKSLHCLAFEDLFESVADFLIDVFEPDDTFLTSKEIQEISALLAGPWAQNLMAQLNTNDVEYEVIIFEQLVLAFGQSSASVILKDPNQYAHIMAMAHRITRTQNVEEIDQTLSNLVVDYWETMIQAANHLDRAQNGLGLIGNDWLRALEQLCFCIALPLDDNGEFVKYGQDHLISDYRVRVKDLIYYSYDTMGPIVLTKLATMSIESYNNEGPPECWGMIEAIFLCLTGMAESLKAIGAEDTIVKQLLTSQLYKDLVDFDKPIPTKLRKVAMNLIGEFDQFFSRHPDFLLSGIETLFQCLRYPQFAEEAAGGILGLCDLNREMLVPKLDAFIEIAEKFFQSGQGNAKSREDISGSIAAIIQAIPNEVERMTSINKLLTFVSNDYRNRAQAFLASGDGEGLQELKIQILNQLKSIANQSRDPQDTAIDVDAEDTIQNTPIWSISHQTIISLLGAILDNSMNDPQIFPLVCEVLQEGYKEQTAGPFVFPPDVTVTLLTTINLSNPRIDVAIRTASQFVSANNSKPSRIAAFLPPILPWICKLVAEATSPLAPAPLDSDFTYNIIDFLGRLTPKHLLYFAPVPPPAINALFSLTIIALSGAETLPKRAAAGLWTDLLSIPTSSPSLPLLTHLLGTLGAALVQILVFQFGGHATRSQLEQLSEPYRKLVARGAQLGVPWKQWTEAALLDPRFGYPGRERQVSGLEKERFVRQIELCRGERRTKDVVREFWLACRGISAGYG